MADTAGIFSECAIAFVPSASLPPKLISSLQAILTEHGATAVDYRRDGSLPIERVTHIISNTIDFPQYIESQAFMIPVVSTQWITVSISRRRQAQVRPFSPDPRMIFSEVMVTCADIPPMDKESILGATMALGGQESKDAGKLTTHICALSMDHPKVVSALEKNWKGKIVLPHWFDDCFKLGKRIDEGPYLLPEPEILKKGPDEDLDIPSNNNLVGASSANPEFISLSDGNSARPPVTVFQDKKILLGADLKITGRLENALKDIIIYGGGRLVQDVDDCDTLICQYRDGEQYVRASQSCKEVANLSWLYFLIAHNEWTSPLHRLLHYPIPKNGIPGFKDMRITVSNYGGEARIYLENLIKACGAEFTKTMKADNTHLITARNSSEKCKAAPEWGITVVNHLWIEESYAKCEIQPVNVKKYNHFPIRTNLGEIIGQTTFNESRLRDLFYPGGEETMSPRAKRKRKILEAAEDNAYSHGPMEGVVIGEVAQGESDAMQEDNSEEDDIPSAVSKKSRPSRALATPKRVRPADAGKENETPTSVSTGGRSAKTKAMDRLSLIAPDIALYEKEKKRNTKPGTPFGGKHAAKLTEENVNNKKKSASHKDGDDDEDRPAKKSRPSLPGVEMRIILTGFTRWVGSQIKEDQDRRKLRDLGIQIVQEGQPCDYLAAPHVVRTVKFLCALARGPTVISSTFIEKTLETGQLQDVEDFILKDAEAESKYDVNLEKSVARAKAHRGKLLRSIPIYCTDKIKNGPESYRAIAEANGAMFMIYRARSGTTIKPTTAEQDGFAPPEPVYLLSGTTSEEKQLWKRFKEMAINGHMEPRVVSPDWLLDVAMAQQVRFDKKFLLEAE
ncbi:hypothetical protein TRIATDRAFT_245434 [Trichoderma atroviride IMI 206040]|uniref:BRCT domain-containing protein n=1 Tax=Hypocrea atroviridis (strain ATCC 20476 / IMI 206040) TaxID=452589 RepID=G9NXT6_HYPAI|nr:uncharacterized protein TRIATDRAFT_245434 [Trichoderma atroviride IMI 206040]EHK44265.1 hypothetical protein TRIATDRAFT_245434 [Trichoderma atroviride IMI 206040]